MDSIFEAEQNHLYEAYDHLKSIEAELISKVEQLRTDASQDKSDMAEELTIDLADFDASLETMANIESLNRIVEAYNLAHSTAEERLARTQLLLRQPYFAKVVLQFKPEKPPREIYLGVAGMTDTNGRSFIVDWRSPVAETYYNQGHGAMTYNAHGRIIRADLLQRRQFDIEGNQLRAYFDTTVAIEDPLLLHALSRRTTSQMRAITATIQKEQNTVIRHSDVPVLLVRGIAGSGKTSVLLQRIAYLLYRERDNLSPDQVHLITPNPVFSRYISHVLPDMGERNPQTTTWARLARGMAIPPRDRGQGEETMDMLHDIDAHCEGASLLPEDCRAVRYKDEVLISSRTVGKLARRFAKVADSRRQCARVAEELHDLLEQHVKSEAASDRLEATIVDMSIEEQCRRFGSPIDPFNEEEVQEAARAYLTELYEPVHRAIDDAGWLSTRRLAKRLIGSRGLKPLERAYLKLVFAGTGDDRARYVFIDEAQDYTQAQFMILARCYPKAHFLLLGDPNQAIYEDTASYDEIVEIFEKLHGEVSQCSLMTSYRSTPEITDLFASLADAKDRIAISSVRPSEMKPVILECENFRDYRRELFQLIDYVENIKEGLTAIIAANETSLEEIHRKLGDMTPRILTERGSLPRQGVILTTLMLAKGLEFDCVIIPDAGAHVYGTDDLSRHRLYTALSRATQKVIVISEGPLTELLKQNLGE